MENCENVKVGDLLISHSRSTKNVVKVERVTPTQLVVTGGGRFRKKDGYRIGSGGFYYSYITIPKEGEVESIKRRNVVETVCYSAKEVLGSYNISYEQALKIKGDAEAEYNRKIAASLSPLIVQQMMIDKWNGTLPTFTGGNGTMLDASKLLK